MNDNNYIETYVNSDGSKEGILAKCKNVFFISASSVQILPEEVENIADKDLITISYLGDGLYYFGGDIFCTYSLLGTTITETSVKFEFEPYYVTVSWTNNDSDGFIRSNPQWVRDYK